MIPNFNRPKPACVGFSQGLLMHPNRNEAYATQVPSVRLQPHVRQRSSSCCPCAIVRSPPVLTGMLVRPGLGLTHVAQPSGQVAAPALGNFTADRPALAQGPRSSPYRQCHRVVLQSADALILQRVEAFRRMRPYEWRLSSGCAYMNCPHLTGPARR